MAQLSKPIGFVYDSEDMELSYYCMSVAKQIYKLINKAKKSFERIFMVNVGDIAVVDPFFKPLVAETDYLPKNKIVEKLHTCSKILWFSKTPMIKEFSHNDNMTHYQFVRPLNWQQSDVKQSRFYDVSLIASQELQKSMICHLCTYEQYNFYPFYGNISVHTDKNETETVIVDIMRMSSITHYQQVLSIIADLIKHTDKLVLLFVPQHLYKFNNPLMNTLESEYSAHFMAVVQPTLDEVFEMVKTSHYYVDLNVNTSVGFFLCLASQLNTIPISYDNKLMRDLLNVQTTNEHKIHLISCETTDDDIAALQPVIPNYEAIKAKLQSILYKWQYDMVIDEAQDRPGREAATQDRMRKYLRVLSSIVQEDYCLLYPRSQRMIDSLPQITQTVALLPSNYYTSAEY
jgi:hypothetical protein